MKKIRKSPIDNLGKFAHPKAIGKVTAVKTRKPSKLKLK
jgi:hypothetical protein